jgi:tetratricopeptide (TPR) repeat protein
MAKDNVNIEILDSRRLPVRVGLAVAVICVMIFGWFAIRWQLGNMLADLTPPNERSAKEVAALAVDFAPSDPTARWLAATVQKDVFTPEAIAATAVSFEAVVRKAPNDYRWWVELGRAREQAEDIAAAEKAFLRALEIAPNYTYPHWQAGNFYLRQNRSEEAFAELKKAAESNSVYRDQVFSVAWDYFDKDTTRLDRIAGDAPTGKANLARFYASKERADDALRIWNTLSEEEKQANIVYAKIIAQSFYERKFYRQSLEFTRSIGIAPDLRGETVQNASFEKPLGDVDDTYFSWVILPVEKVEAKRDAAQKHDNSPSLRIVFNGYNQPQFFHIFQIVTVEPAAKYRLTFWVKTNNLRSGGNPELEIYNANDDKIIAASETFPSGTDDWRQVNLEFSAPANAEAVGIRVVRALCGEQCPIFGTVWLDEFKLERLK